MSPCISSCVQGVLVVLHEWLVKQEVSGRTAVLLKGPVSRISAKQQAIFLCSNHLAFSESLFYCRNDGKYSCTCTIAVLKDFHFIDISLLYSGRIASFRITSDADYVDDVAIMANTPNQVETLLVTKAWTAIDKLSIIWKLDLTDKMKRSFFQAAVVSILLYGCTTWT